MTGDQPWPEAERWPIEKMTTRERVYWALRRYRTADGLVLQRLPNGEYAWLRPEEPTDVA